MTQTQIDRARQLLSREELVRRHAAGETAAGISASLGISIGTFYKRKKELGLNARMRRRTPVRVSAEQVVAIYKRVGSATKTAQKLKKSHKYVAHILKEAGINLRAEAAKSACNHTLCTTCMFGYADKCAFIAANSEDAENVLKSMGAKYIVERYSNRYRRDQEGSIINELSKIKVIRCSKYRKGAQPL